MHRNNGLCPVSYGIFYQLFIYIHRIRTNIHKRPFITTYD